MENIPDAPWIRETERTGYCSARNGAWWNNPPRFADYPDDDEDFNEEDDGDVFYGNEDERF